MPLVYLAHQAPFLPVLRRWPGRLDGPCLLAGSMAPDFAYALQGTRFELWAHAFPGLVTFAVPAALVVAWLTVRGLARVGAAHLPAGGGFHLRDLRGLAAHRFSPPRAALSALIGAWGHVLLDAPGHAWGWPARTWEWFRAPLGEALFLGRPWTAFRIAQYAGHVGWTALAVVLLWRYGRQRWLADAAHRVPEFRATARTHACFWGALACGGIGVLVPVLLAHVSFAPALMRTSLGAFVGALVGVALARRVANAAR